jgi:hypothetical protein
MVIVSCLWYEIHAFNGTLTSAKIARLHNRDPNLKVTLTFRTPYFYFPFWPVTAEIQMDHSCSCY